MFGLPSSVHVHFRQTLLAIFSLAFITTQSCSAYAKDYNELGKTGFALWRCAAYGFLSETKTGQKLSGELFVSGHEMLSELVTDIIAGKAKEEELKDVPIGIKWWLIAGPSVEFRMGYMWSQFEKDAYDKTLPMLKDANFDEQKAIQKNSAQTEFQDGNCRLLNQK
jgi:hypothetical protein